MRGYTQLTLDQRYQIQECTSWKNKFKLDTIAARTGVSKSTISREIRRNRSLRGYRALHAHCKALKRRTNKSHQRIPLATWREVKRLLRKDWSPEQISLWLSSKSICSVSHESIYQYILSNKRNGGTLNKHLRCQKKHKKRYGKYERRGSIRNRVWIDDRPESVEKRWRFGDWEIDTMFGRHSRYPLVTLVERKSRLTVITLVKSKNAEEVAQAIIEALEPYRHRVKTITSDNGKEFAQHEMISSALDAKFYFAHPFASWERGLNENTNGLLRQYFPKKSDFTTITKTQLDRAMERLNNRPRKCLGVKTPNEVFFKNFQPVALAD